LFARTQIYLLTYKVRYINTLPLPFPLFVLFDVTLSLPLESKWLRFLVFIVLRPNETETILARRDAGSKTSDANR